MRKNEELNPTSKLLAALDFFRVYYTAECPTPEKYFKVDYHLRIFREVFPLVGLNVPIDITLVSEDLKSKQFLNKATILPQLVKAIDELNNKDVVLPIPGKDFSSSEALQALSVKLSSDIGALAGVKIILPEHRRRSNHVDTLVDLGYKRRDTVSAVFNNGVPELLLDHVKLAFDQTPLNTISKYLLQYRSYSVMLPFLFPTGPRVVPDVDAIRTVSIGNGINETIRVIFREDDDALLYYIQGQHLVLNHAYPLTLGERQEVTKLVESIIPGIVVGLMYSSHSIIVALLNDLAHDLASGSEQMWLNKHGKHLCYPDSLQYLSAVMVADKLNLPMDGVDKLSSIDFDTCKVVQSESHPSLYEVVSK